MRLNYAADAMYRNDRGATFSSLATGFTLALLGTAFACPRPTGYRLLLGKAIPLEHSDAIFQVQTPRTGDSYNVTDIASACSKSSACTAFSTQGELLLGPIDGPWMELPAAAASCSGIYVRSALAVGGGWGQNVTGIEVSPDFDLPGQYYNRILWPECVLLCESTPGCRSVSYLATEQVCSLKAATCLEAQFGVGCRVIGHWFETFIHRDRSTTFDFMTSTWAGSIPLVGLTSQLASFKDAQAACEQLGLQLSSIHTTERWSTLALAALKAAANLQPQPASGPWTFWLNGMQNTSTPDGVYWLDGTRYLLGANYSVASPKGCMALTFPNPSVGVANVTLTVQSCAQGGFPVCSVFPPGAVTWRYQAESTVVEVMDHRMSHEDAAVFCSARGGGLFQPSGIRGLELLNDAAYHDPFYDGWVNGYCINHVCTWSDGSSVPSELVSIQMSGATCLATSYKLATPLITRDCFDSLTPVCKRMQDPVPQQIDTPARVRFHGGGFALAFFTSPRTYLEAEQQCQARDGHLVSIPDNATNAVVSETWYDLDPPSNNFNFLFKFVRRILGFLGADSLNGNGLTWRDGTPYLYEGEKLGVFSPTAEGCVIMSSFGAAGPSKWEMLQRSDCNMVRFNYTCKLPAKTFVQPSAVLANEGAVYELHDSIPRTYPDAQEACLARGGGMASLDMVYTMEDVVVFIRRLRHERRGYHPIMGDTYAYFVGAVTNKTGRSLTMNDFTWQDGSENPWWLWSAGYPFDQAVNYTFAPGTLTVGALASIEGPNVLVRKRYNHSLPFLCKVPISAPLASLNVDDGATYEVFSSPYALPYHAAEQVCQSRGGHLAGMSSQQGLQVASQLCRKALESLPRAFNGSSESHDITDSCWVGLYCPGGYNADVSFKDGFGERGLQQLAGIQSGFLRARACNMTADLVWLDGRNPTDVTAENGGDGAGGGGWKGVLGAAAGTLGTAARCGAVHVGAGSDASSASLVMAPCNKFAAFVCSRGGVVVVPAPALSVRSEPLDSAESAVAVEASAGLIPEGSVQYQGCFAVAAAAPGAVSSPSSVDPTVKGTSLVVVPTPLPILLARHVTSLAKCYNLTLQAGLSYFGIVGGEACWAGPTGPVLPFFSVPDDSPCMRSCGSGRAGNNSTANDSSSSVGAQPGCGADGFTAVFRILKTSTASPSSASAAVTTTTASSPYVCMRDQLLAAPNATLVAQLHVSPSQLHVCERLCTSLPACDMYSYHVQARACVLLSAPETPSLATLHVVEALWARVTCVKATRVVAGAVLTWLPLKAPTLGAASGSGSSGSALSSGVAATHICGAGLARGLETAGTPALSPRNGLLVGDVGECAASCAFNATCHGFVVRPVDSSNINSSGAGSNGNGNGTILLCLTRAGLVVSQGSKWIMGRSWVQIASASSDIITDEKEGQGCLALSTLVPPPPYVCTDMVDAAGWELRRLLNTSNEQVCRDACDQDKLCSFYVLYTSPPICSLRFRAFYEGSLGAPYIVGTNKRPGVDARGTVKTCLHTFRLLLPYVSPAAGRHSRQVRLGADAAWHTCVPHMDVRGLDTFSSSTFWDTECGQDCANNPSCNHFITSSDDFPGGVCYAKTNPILFTFGEIEEFPSSDGHTRIDMMSVTDACLNMERQLPRSHPVLACTQHYAAALPELSRQTTPTAFACEAACMANTSCLAYTWMGHNATCVLGTATPTPTTSTTSATPSPMPLTSGPSWLATQTCLHVPRLLVPPGGQATALRQPLQVDGVWHYCLEGSGSAADLVPVTAVAGGGSTVGPDVLAARQLNNAGISSADSSPVRRCVRECGMTRGCQGFTLSWRNVSDTSPMCWLQGWSSLTALSSPARETSTGSSTGSTGRSGQSGERSVGGPLLNCMAVAAERGPLPTGAAGLVHPRPRPAVVQSYRSKQYSVYLDAASYGVAASICQGGASEGGGSGRGQLVAINSAQEAQVLAALLKPYGALQFQPSAGTPLQRVAFWTGLVFRSTSASSSSSSDCTGNWCYSHGRWTNASFVQALMGAAWGRVTATEGGNNSSVLASCVATALQTQPDGSYGPGALITPANCSDWSLPFICEYEMPPLSIPCDSTINGGDAATTTLLLQLFTAAAGYDDAVALAAAAGAVMMQLDLSFSSTTFSSQTAAASSHHHRLRYRSLSRSLSATTTTSAAHQPLRLTELSAAVTLCGPQQLQSSGCWMGFTPPPGACTSTSTSTDPSAGPSSVLCGAVGLLLLDATSSAAAQATELTAALGATATDDGSCVMALVSNNDPLSSTTTSGVDVASPPSYLPVRCATPAGFLATLVDPDAPLRAALVSPAPPPPQKVDDGGLSRAAPAADRRLSGGTLAGIIVGCVLGALVLLFVAAAAFLWRRQNVLRLASQDTALGPSGVKVPSSATSAAGTTASKTPGPDGAAGEDGNGARGSECVEAQVTLEVAEQTGGTSAGALARFKTPAMHSTEAGANTDSLQSSYHGAGGEGPERVSGAIPRVRSTCMSDNDMSAPVASTKSNGTYDTSTSSWMGHFRDGPPSRRQQPQLLVTAEDPDQMDVTWHIDPKRDVTWDEKDKLGKGAFGIVYRGTYRGESVAIKTVIQSGQGQYEMDGLRSLLQEARILAKVRHPNIVTCYGGCITDTHVFIVEELMSMTLGQLISSAQPELLPLDGVLRIGIDIANGLFQLHPTIVHRDLKPDNVLLDASGMAKISDFGLARFKLSSFLSSTRNLAAGTIPFMAPETLRDELPKISEKADIYSLAVILWAMLTGQQQPWKDFHFAAVLYKVSMRGERPPLPADPARCSPRLTGLIHRMWAQEPASRPGAGEVMKQLGVILRDVVRGTHAPGTPSSAALASAGASTCEGRSSTNDGGGRGGGGGSAMHGMVCESGLTSTESQGVSLYGDVERGGRGG